MNNLCRTVFQENRNTYIAFIFIQICSSDTQVQRLLFVSYKKYDDSPTIKHHGTRTFVDNLYIYMNFTETSVNSYKIIRSEIIIIYKFSSFIKIWTNSPIKWKYICFLFISKDVNPIFLSINVQKIIKLNDVTKIIFCRTDFFFFFDRDSASYSLSASWCHRSDIRYWMCVLLVRLRSTFRSRNRMNESIEQVFVVWKTWIDV